MRVWLIEGNDMDGTVFYSPTLEGKWSVSPDDAKIFETEDAADEFCASKLDGSECVPCGPVPYLIATVRKFHRLEK